MKITNVIARDVRFPTSRLLDGSDAMNPDPDYSAAYVTLETDQPGLAGYGMAFTIGRGNELVVAAINSLAPLVLGRTLESFTDNMGRFWRHITGDSQLRWVGPEKGVIHLGTAAIVNAVWDLYAKVEGKPLWKLLADMSAQQIVDCVDWRYMTDALTPEDAVAMLTENEPTKAKREAHIREVGYPAYSTGAGWLGYPDDKLRRLCREFLSRGFRHLKIKVGRDLADDVRRCTIIREEMGDDATLMTDANQVWDVQQAIDHMKALARFKPLWIEEPTSPDDVLGHAAIANALKPYGIGVATGEMCQNRVMFKQFMQAGAIQFVQIDSTRLGGVNEVLAVYLLAKKFSLPVCPHAGGIGLCEHVQHLQTWDYIACSATMDNRIIEYVDHLHEHMTHPVRMQDNRYMPPESPGYGTEIKPSSVAEYEFPAGAAWRDAR